MSLFKPSSESAKSPHVKILLWGPEGSGKTHFALSAPKPALIDVENRAVNFAQRREFTFAHAEIASLDELGHAFKEIKTGAIDCESVVIDSGSAIYTALVEEHTARTQQGAYVTDWVTVNRRFLKCLNFVFAMTGKNVLFTAHAATKLIREGRDFRTAGLKFVGDNRFRYGFDYIFRIEPKGDPTKTPALFHVEKTSSPNMKLGEAISGLTWLKFRELTNARDSLAGGEPPAAPTAAPSAASPHGSRLGRIEDLAAQLQLTELELGTFVRGITRHKTASVKDMRPDECDRLIAILEQRLKGAA